jgi:hypothetical protein
MHPRLAHEKSMMLVMHHRNLRFCLQNKKFAGKEKKMFKLFSKKLSKYNKNQLRKMEEYRSLQVRIF